MSTPTISNSTKVSIALVVTIVLGAYALGAKFSAGDAKDIQQDAIISSMATNIATLTDNVVTMKGDIIEVKTIVKSLAERGNGVSAARPTSRLVVVTSQGATQPVTPANQPAQNSPPANPQPADPPEQAPVLPCTLLPILCNQGRLL